MDEIKNFKDAHTRASRPKAKDESVSSKAPTYPVATIAKLLMLSDRRVQQLTKEGVIPKAERGRYELAPAVQGYIRYLQERSLRSDASPIDYHVEKARLTKAQADLAEIEAAKALNEVAPVAQIEHAWANFCAETRVRARNIPERVVSSLVGCTEERQIKALLLREIDQVLAEMADADALIEPTEDDDTQHDGEV